MIEKGKQMFRISFSRSRSFLDVIEMEGRVIRFDARDCESDDTSSDVSHRSVGRVMTITTYLAHMTALSIQTYPIVLLLVLIQF